MSLFRRRLGWDKKKKKTKQPAERIERKAPTLDAKAGATPGGKIQRGEIKQKVQGEVCAVMARTILELIQSSQARTPSVDELIQRQTINRLYADVLYDFLSSGAPPSVDPADEVLGWAREAMANWGKDQRNMTEDKDMVRETAAMAESILAMLETASRDETLRKAAQQRFKATGRLTAED
jgi:hypothetical protein